MAYILMKIRISAFAFILTHFVARTVQSSTEMFVCFSDVCSRKGYFECSETERRCKECAVFYTATCGTERQPSGCYAYCTGTHLAFDLGKTEKCLLVPTCTCCISKGFPQVIRYFEEQNLCRCAVWL